jgi:hypothetical protein
MSIDWHTLSDSCEHNHLYCSIQFNSEDVTATQLTMLEDPIARDGTEFYCRRCDYEGRSDINDGERVRESFSPKSRCGDRVVRHPPDWNGICTGMQDTKRVSRTESLWTPS